MTLDLEKYRIKDGVTDINAQELNDRFYALVRRLHALELVKVTWDQAVAEVQNHGLERINSVIQPVLDEANLLLAEAEARLAEAALVIPAVGPSETHKLIGVDAAGTGYELVSLLDRLEGTLDQVSVAAGEAGQVVLSLPQAIAPGSSPEFAGLKLTQQASAPEVAAGKGVLYTQAVNEVPEAFFRSAAGNVQVTSGGKVLPLLSDEYPADPAAEASAGSSAEASRADHVHQVPEWPELASAVLVQDGIMSDWSTIDLSSVVPLGTRAVRLWIRLYHGSTGAKLQMYLRRQSGTATYSVYTSLDIGEFDVTIPVAISSSRTFDAYNQWPSGLTTCKLYVAGYA